MFIKIPVDGAQTCRKRPTIQKTTLRSMVAAIPGRHDIASTPPCANRAKQGASWSIMNLFMASSSTKAAVAHEKAAASDGDTQPKSARCNAVGKAMPNPCPLICATAAIGWPPHLVAKPARTATKLCRPPVAAPFKTMATFIEFCCSCQPMNAKSSPARLRTIMYATNEAMRQDCILMEGRAIPLGLRIPSDNKKSIVVVDPRNCARLISTKQSLPSSDAIQATLKTRPLKVTSEAAPKKKNESLTSLDSASASGSNASDGMGIHEPRHAAQPKPPVRLDAVT
mmetsp:Transcript_118706/g.335778  ORF Transcript_118706/g.335778 Transcript_118706/m.335778 type:complete len:283 (+) Transcript_118706:470-1318(+)